MDETALLSAAEALAQQWTKPIQTVLILGSGFSQLARQVLNNAPDRLVLPYGEIPHFPQPTVVGHQGTLLLGTPPGSPHALACFCGRFHLYEGWHASQVVAPVRLGKLLGAERLFVTNAAGGIHPDFQPGDLMLISDHINLLGHNPLSGTNLERFGPRFPDMSEAYSSSLRQAARHIAQQQGLVLKEGVYAAVAGPCYETPAEIRMLKTLGADAVGMSTVPEVIAARHAGMEVLGISCISNKAAGLGDSQLNHQEVIDVTARSENALGCLVQAMLASV
ncbi:MAG: purine-nucleoside phosphorylase [Candidatus Melainabacteria bacterium]|nr:purine-nucleoside phosphorylase [Candidatus Melainabacteria bacterium]